jgi:acetaldehyde dehydrogenase (acetylating)
MQERIRELGRKSAVRAFARGHKLPKATRKRILEHFEDAPKMSLRAAIIVNIQYAAGMLPELKENLAILTRAWLRLGEKLWQKIFSAARGIKWEVASHFKPWKSWERAIKKEPALATW